MRQSNGVAGADYRLVADNHIGVGCGGETLALAIAEIDDTIAGTCAGTHLSEHSCSSIHTVGHITCQTIGEGRSAGEYYFDIGILVAANIVGSFDDCCRRLRTYHHLVFGDTGGDDGVAVALVTCLVASASHVGESSVARNGLGVVHVIVAVEQTSGRIVVGRGRGIYITRATAAGVAGCRVARHTAAAAIPAAAAASTAGTACSLSAVTALAEVAVLTVNAGAVQCSVCVRTAGASVAACSLSTWLTSGSRVVVRALQTAAHSTGVAVGRTATAACHDSTCVERGRVDTDIGGTAAATALIVLSGVGMNTGIAAAVPTAGIVNAYICGGFGVLAPAADKHVECVALMYRQVTFGVAALTASVKRCR